MPPKLVRNAGITGKHWHVNGGILLARNESLALGLPMSLSFQSPLDLGMATSNGAQLLVKSRSFIDSKGISNHVELAMEQNRLYISIPYFRGMNIHLLAILLFTRVLRFLTHNQIWKFGSMDIHGKRMKKPQPSLAHWTSIGPSWNLFIPIIRVAWYFPQNHLSKGQMNHSALVNGSISFETVETNQFEGLIILTHRHLGLVLKKAVCISANEVSDDVS